MKYSHGVAVLLTSRCGWLHKVSFSTATSCMFTYIFCVLAKFDLWWIRLHVRLELLSFILQYDYYVDESDQQKPSFTMDVILRTQNTIRVCNSDIAIKWEFVILFPSRSFTFETGICNKSKMLVRCYT